MDADNSRLQSALAGAEARIFNLERELKTLDLLFAGKTRQNIVLPSGVAGFNQIFEVIAQPLAIVPDDDDGDGEDHPWKVDAATDDAGNVTLTILGGRVFTDTTSFEAADLELGATGSGVVYLKFSYDPEGENVIGIETNYSGTIPGDTDTEKHWEIATVTTTDADGALTIDSIFQRMFEDVHLERMAGPEEPTGPGGTLPTGTYDGEILFWDVATAAWKVSAAPTAAAIPYWDETTKEYLWIASGTSGHYLQTSGATHAWAEVVGGGTDTIAVVEDIGSPDAQVTVTSAVVGATTTYTVRGNSVEKLLRYQIGSATPVELANFKDGLITDAVDPEGYYVDILIPAGDGLPAGTAGDMLYHDGSAWVVLDAATAAPSGTINILTQDGTAMPVWSNKTIVTVDLCSGSGTTSHNFISL